MSGGPARLLDGEAASAAVRERVRSRVAALAERGCTPGVAVVQAGHAAASDIYVRRKLEAAEALGFHARLVPVEEREGFAALMAHVARLNEDPLVHAFLVQTPLPEGWPLGQALGAVAPGKDADGFHPINVGRATLGEGGFWPATALGVVELLRHHGIPLAGMHAVVVGRSRVVGRPLASLLSQREANATVTLCHTGSGDLARFTTTADIVVAAAGRPGWLTGGMIREGAVVVDVGIHRVPYPERPGRTHLVGDVDAASVAPRAAWLSPVPGGVGPMTVALLLQNAVTACERSLA